MTSNELPVLGQAEPAAPGADGAPARRLGRGPIGAVIGPTERSGGAGQALASSVEVLARAAEEAGVSAEPSIPEDAVEEVRPLWAALCEIRDPELPVSLVDLGLIYDVRRDGGRVEVDMTFTATGCPCMMVMEMDVQDRLLEEPAVDEVTVNVVWDPPWTRARMTEKAVEILRCFGVAA